MIAPARKDRALTITSTRNAGSPPTVSAMSASRAPSAKQPERTMSTTAKKWSYGPSGDTRSMRVNSAL